MSRKLTLGDSTEGTEALILRSALLLSSPAFYCSDKTVSETNLGGKGLSHLTGYHLSGVEDKAGTEAETVEDCCLLTCSLAHSVSFLTQ